MRARVADTHDVREGDVFTTGRSHASYIVTLAKQQVTGTPAKTTRAVQQGDGHATPQTIQTICTFSRQSK